MRPSPAPLNTTNLIVNSKSSMDLTAYQVTTAAESLYIHDNISYPRTHSTEYYMGFNFAKILATIVNTEAYNPAAARLFPRGSIPNSVTNVVDPSASPIHPLCFLPRMETILPVNRIVLDFITNHFLLTIARDAQVQTETVVLNILGVTFQVTHESAIRPGWLIFNPLRLAQVSSQSLAGA